MASKEPLVISWGQDSSSKTHELPQQVQKIIAQKGALRDISEAIIAEDLKKSDQLVTKDEDEAGDKEVEESSESRLKKLWETRNEMIQRLDYAQMEIVSALDFVSLLLSSHSVGASSSMSAALKEVAPVGSLDLQRIQIKNSTKATNQNLMTVSQTLRSQNFILASDRMADASERLSKEANQQSRYWEQISQLQSHGWPISRLPSDSRSIVVHYGSSESALYYRSRGYTVLRQNADGDLEIVPPANSQSFIRITVIRDGKESGIKDMESNLHDDLTGIQSQLIEARDHLFRQELFYELGREAQIITNHGVSLQHGVVDISISSSFRIRITQTDQKVPKPTITGSIDASLAEFVADALCVLLTAEHDASFVRRSTHAPQPISNVPRAIPEYALLRPVIAQLRHHTQVRKITDYISKFSHSLDQAGLNISLKVQNTTQTSEKDLAATMLRQPARSEILVDLPTGKKLELNIETYLAAPVYGVRISAKVVNYGFATLELTSTNSFAEVEDHIKSALMLDLEATVFAQNSENGNWVVVKAFAGELAFVKNSQKLAKMKIRCSEDGIGLNAVQRDQTGSNVYVWTGQSAVHIDDKQDRHKLKDNFQEVVRKITSLRV